MFSIGFDLTDLPVLRNDVFALGFATGEPSQNNLRTQYVLESFYRIRLYSILQVTPDIQFIINPSNNPEHDLIVVYRIRFRVAF